MSQITPEMKAKQIAVAKDVLERIEFLRWSRYDYLNGGQTLLAHPEDDLQQHVQAAEQECRVCLLGGCLLSKARLFDGVPIDLLISERGRAWSFIYIDRDETLALLRDVFTEEQMDMLESGFQCGEYTENEDECTYREKLEQAAAFGKRRATPRQRVRDILTNFIEHDAEFVPEDDPLLVVATT